MSPPRLSKSALRQVLVGIVLKTIINSGGSEFVACIREGDLLQASLTVQIHDALLDLPDPCLHRDCPKEPHSVEKGQLGNITLS